MVNQVQSLPWIELPDSFKNGGSTGIGEGGSITNRNNLEPDEIAVARVTEALIMILMQVL